MQKLINQFVLNLLRLFCLISFVLVSVPTSFASETFSYSGRLVNTNGSPVSGQVNLTFDLAYSDQTGVILCTEQLNGVDLVNGVFHVKLVFGSCNLPNVLANIPTGQTIIIRVTDRTPNPDRVYSFQSIHSVPYSIMSQMSKQLVQMGAIDGQVLTWRGGQWNAENPTGATNGTVTQITATDGLSGGTIVASGTIGIADNGVTSARILDDTIVDADISGTAEIAQSKIKNLTTDLAAKESLIGTGSSTDYLDGTKAWNNFDQSVRNALLIGYTTGTATPVSATDNVMEAIGKLEGQIIANDTAFDNAGQWDKDGSLLFYTAGNVGIGTATPSDKLEVVGDISLSGKLRLKNSSISYVELKAPVGAGAITYTLPGTLGTNGQILSTDNLGNLSWLTPSTDSSQITDGSIVDADVSGSANIAQSKISGLVTALSGKEPTLASGVAGQYLAGGKVWATLNTDAVPEGATRLYFTEDKVLATDLLGLDTTAGSVTAADSILLAIGKTVGNVTALTTTQSDYLKKDGSVTMTGDLDVGGKAIINLLDPVAAQDAATKAYVDSAITSPAGNNKAIQFNNAGAFGANDNLVWDNTNRRLGVDGSGVATAPLSPLHVHVNANEAVRVSHNGGYHWGLVPSGSTLSIKDLTNNLNRLTIGNTSGNYVEMNGTLKLTGATSGFTGLASPAIGSNVTYTLPVADGSGGYVLSTNGSGALSWVAQPTSLAPSGTAGGDLSGTYPNPTITGLAATKISDGSIDNTEFGYLNGVSSNLQTQLDAKEATIVAGTIDQYWAGTKAWRDFDADVRTALLSAYSVTAGVVASGDGIQTAISKLDGNIASLQANGQWTKNSTNIYYNSGNVGIGTTTPVSILHTSGTSPVFHNRYGAIASHLVLRSARGTSGAPTAVQAGEVIGTFSGEGYDGSGYSESAQMRILATENQTPTTKGSEFTFWTVPNGSTSSSITRRMTIGNDGNVGIGTTTPLGVLDIRSTDSGILIPQMTTVQRNAIATPFGMQIYNTDTNKINYHDGSTWQELGLAGGVNSIVAGVGLVSTTITDSGTLNVDVGTTAGKIPQLDGSGKLATSVETDPTVAAFAKNTLPTCAAGEVLKSDGTSLSCVTDSSLNADGLTLTTTGTTISVKAEGILDTHLKGISTSCGIGQMLLTNGLGSFYCADKQWSEFASGLYYNSGSIAIGGTATDSSAVLDLQSTTKGFLPPRMTTAQRDGISTPAPGLMVYNTTTNIMQYFNNTKWIDLYGGTVILDSGSVSGSVTLSKTVTVDQPATVIFTSYMKGANFPLVSLQFNGVTCAVDRSLADLGNQYSSASCVKDLSVGSHTFKSIYGETSGTESFETHSMSWVVIAKSAGTNEVALSSSLWDENGTNLYYTEGNVGIGTTSPGALLDVSSNGQTYARISTTVNNSSAELTFSNSGATDWVLGADGPFRNSITNNGFHFWKSGYGTAMVLDETGNVGVGTTSPIAKLHLKGADGRAITVSPGTTSQSINFIHNDNGNVNARYANITGVLSNGGTGYNHGHLAFSTAPDTTGNPASIERMRITGSGNVGIGTTAPAYKLDVRGGNVNSEGAITNVSDRRLKENILPLDSTLEKVLQLESVSYVWKDRSFDPSKQVGFIAQDVEKVFPEVVKTDSKGYKAMSYSQLISPVVKAIQELYAKWSDDHDEIEKLKNENAVLKAQNEEILKRLDRLENERKPASNTQ